MEYAYLRVKTADGERPVELGSTALTVGRHESNALVLKDSMASRFHCVIERSGDGYMLRDLQSRNGTLLNGQRVMIAQLKSGDVVAIGEVQMKIILHHVSRSLAGKKEEAIPSGALTPASNAAIGAPSLDPLDDLEVIGTADAPGPAVPEDPAMLPFNILRRAADAMPDRTHDIDAISLVSPRGNVLHEGMQKAAPGGPGDAVFFLRLTMLVAFRTHASDIHLEPRERSYFLRIRMDGNLLDVTELDQDLGQRLTALVKVLCELDTTQKHIVQEGHFASIAPQPASSKPAAPLPPGAPPPSTTRRVDYRVSFVPSLHGQKMVIRIFDMANAPQTLEELHLPASVHARLSTELGREGGLILVCGPTGSGKTTTLYALLRSCSRSFRNIITIEDPVEIQLESTTQLPVDDSAGKTFAALLRSVLRQDPDIIMVGEIRDPETAKIALQAAMTGHLVLSTIHTRDTPGTIFRLLDLGTDAYMVSQGLQLVLAQRLVRALCKSCKRAYSPSAEDKKKMGRYAEGIERIYAPIGCQKCLGTGYYGRRGIFEFLNANDKLRDLIMRNPSSRDIQESLGPEFVTLTDNAYELVARGVTSVDEIERTVGR